MSTEPIFNPGALSLNAASTASTQTGTSRSMKKAWTAWIYVVATGTPTGTVTVEASPDRAEQQPANGQIVPTDTTATWITVPAAMMLGTIPALAGAAASFIVAIPQVAASRLRVKYVGTGAGTITAWIVAQG